MKKISKLFISAGLLAMAATGCTDLDVDIPSPSPEYPASEIAIAAKIAHGYSAFPGAL